MQWTNFDPTITNPTAAGNHVTLSPRGEFYLNYGAMMNLGYPAAVRLMFEKDERLIGIASAPLNAKASYKLRSKYGSDVTSRIFRATSFCRHLGILPDRTIMFRDPKIENGVLVLDLKTTVYAPKRATPIASDMPEAGHALPPDREESSKY
jgi:hypothetical protein